MPLENMAAIHAVARQAGLPVHLDGARLFNAAAYLGRADRRDLPPHRFGLVRAVQGAGRPGRGDPGGRRGVHGAGAPRRQDARRRHAPGRTDRRAGDRRAEGSLRRPPARPRARAEAGARARRIDASLVEVDARADQHRQLLRRPLRRRRRRDQSRAAGSAASWPTASGPRSASSRIPRSTRPRSRRRSPRSPR